MSEMTPRERSELVRRQSRDYIAALRAGRLQRSRKAAPVSVPTREKTPSSFHPSSQASARAMEARTKPVTGSAEDGPSPREEAAAIRRTSAEALTQMRDARRPRTARAGKVKARKSGAPTTTVDAPLQATIMAPKPAAGLDPQQPPAPADIAADSRRASPEGDPAASLPLRRARAKRAPDRAAGPTDAGSRDIDVITGLGPALKSKLRQSGIATVEILSAQRTERLREILGPAGRLVNLDSLVRAAKTACGDAVPAPAGTARAPARLAVSRRNGS